MRTTYQIFIILFLSSMSLHAQTDSDKWVDGVFKNLTLEEKIGQLFTIRASAKEDEQEAKKVLSYIDKYKVGGICFFQGSPTQLTVLNNRYQQKSKVPILTSIDGEWGLGMRYPDQSISFPRALTLGAIQDNNLIYEMGTHIADHCKRVGIHVNFAPVVDVNNNPNNPVINNRSFGEDKYNVAAKSYAYMKGMQENGVMACAKHFPGHGDTDTDSHYDLPVITHDRNRLDSVELMPFRSLIKQGIGSVMVAHLSIPAFDDRPNRPTTLSYNAVTNILRKEMTFGGLIFTDAMEMKGVTKHFKPGDADKEAFIAGNDIILLPENLKAGIESIKKGIMDGSIPRERLDNSVKRILRAKYTLGLNTWKPLDQNNVESDINDNNSIALKEKLIENAITLASDQDEIVPIRKLNGMKFSSISIGAGFKTPMQTQMDFYVTAQHNQLPRLSTKIERERIAEKVKGSDYVVVGIHDMSKYAGKDFGINLKNIAFLKELEKDKKLIIIIFGSPYSLKFFDGFSNVIVAYEDDELFQNLAVQSIFGAFTIKGKLPVTASSKYKYGGGKYRESLGRFGYSIPERVGMSSTVLAGIDTIINEMLPTKAAPGCQILAAKGGKIVFQKSYGNFVYDKARPVDNNDIYDVASVTKVCASTISLMKLYDEGKFDLNATIDRYIPETDTCSKGDVNIRATLAHHAQLAGWIPFYKNTVSTSKNNPQPLGKYYSKTLKEGFTVPVADNLFMRTDMRDSIWSRINGSKLREKKGYRYSDLAFYFMHKSIQNITGLPINEYAAKNFYEPMGLRRTGYLPLAKHPREEIAPSEHDRYFRRQTIKGHVHDMGAAMLGGVSGHAGLFSNAGELAVIFQMMLNGGSYGGVQYLEPETIKLFTTRYPESTRRGLGWDMKELNPSKSLNMSKLASDSTFGHLGFTGIAAFADPKEDLIFIFVANRTYPSMKNLKFSRGNYRPRVQSQIYRSLMKEEAQVVVDEM